MFLFLNEKAQPQDNDLNPIILLSDRDNIFPSEKPPTVNIETFCFILQSMIFIVL